MLVHRPGALAAFADASRGVAPTSGDAPDFDHKLATECSKGGLDLFETARVSQIQDAVDLGQVPGQAAGEAGLADALLAHRLIQCKLCADERRWPNRRAPCGLGGRRKIAVPFDVEGEGRFQGVSCPQQGLLLRNVVKRSGRLEPCRRAPSPTLSGIKMRKV